MDTQRFHTWSRRNFLRGLTVAGGAGLLGLQPSRAAVESPPETTTITIVFDPDIPILCYGPQYVATELLRLEGFTDIRYIPYDEEASDAKHVASGLADISTVWAGDFVTQADRRSSIVALSGMHIGCTEIFASDRVQSFQDLRGKKLALWGGGGGV
ncbi:MAG: twin-arginine translocation signal domain-containing protein, partial [Gammaproteobacteria bacterium]|nr:twin-arginine translocation signal domain-containing protein [Gammaproteobacteria bacterium]